MIESSDGALLAGHEPGMFAEVYRRHAIAVVSWVYRRTLDAHLAADITAETFAQAWLHRRRFRADEESARPWLIGIARNLLRRYHRRLRIEDRARRSLGMPVRDLDPESERRIEDLVEAETWRPRLSAALDVLPDSQREAVRLRVIDDLPYAEVATRLECSEGAARVRVSRALSTLQRELEQQP
jgi:RNA polymerase sigma factor (sigma-70 family)